MPLAALVPQLVNDLAFLPIGALEAAQHTNHNESNTAESNPVFMQHSLPPPWLLMYATLCIYLHLMEIIWTIT